MRAQLAGLVLACVWAFGALGAQGATHVVQPGERIRLVLRGVGDARGEFVGSSADSIVLLTAQQARRAVPRSEVRLVQIAAGRSAARGARNGLLAVGGTTWAACTVVIGIAAAAEGAGADLVYVPLFCLPAAAFFGAVGAVFGGAFAAEQWAPAALPVTPSNVVPEY